MDEWYVLMLIAHILVVQNLKFLHVASCDVNLQISDKSVSTTILWSCVRAGLV